MNSYIQPAFLYNRRESLKQEIDLEFDNVEANSRPDYFSNEYWEQRYRNDTEPFDWYLTWNDLKEIILPEIKKYDSALYVGCGSSTIAYNLIQDGFHKVTGLDISKTVISQNKSRYSNISNLDFIAEDVGKMDTIFPKNSFDFIIDKGMMDSMITSLSSSRNVPQMMNKIHDVLNQNGIFVEISYGVPATRFFYFANLNDYWTVFEPKIVKGTKSGRNYYIYMARKK